MINAGHRCEARRLSCRHVIFQMKMDLRMQYPMKSGFRKIVWGNNKKSAWCPRPETNIFNYQYLTSDIRKFFEEKMK